MKIITTSSIKSILTISLIVSGNILFAQSPGGVSNLTSWFKADQGVFTNSGGTINAGNGQVVLHWENQQANATLPHVISTGNPTLLTVNPYYNFNNLIRFTSDFYTRTIPHNGVFNPTAGASAFVVATSRSLPFSFTSTSTASPCNGNRCNVGFRWNRTEMSGPDLAYNTLGTTTSNRGNIVGVWGNPGSTQSNTVNGWQNTNTNSSVIANISSYNYRIGNFPGYSFSGSIPEVFTFNKDLTVNEVSRIQSYMAIKYGLTLRDNDPAGLSLNYISSNNTLVWDASNPLWNNDIAGLARDDNSGLHQRKSHSVNNTAGVFDDIVTIVNGMYFGIPQSITADNSFLMWGHNDGPLSGTPQIFTTNNLGTTIPPVVAPFIETMEVLFDRHWLSQETGTVGTVSLWFDMSAVVGISGVGTNDLNDVRLLVDVDGDFTVGASSITPTAANNTLDYVLFRHDFNAATGFYYTLASIDQTSAPLPVELISFGANCENNRVKLKWATATEINSDYFVVEKSTDATNFDPIAEIQANGNSTSISNYEWVDNSSSKQLGETNYYRLKQVDLNGEFEYFKMIAINCADLSPINIYPNPVNNLLNISFGNSSPNQEYKIEIRDYVGRLIIEKKVTISGSIYQMKLDELHSKGVYYIKIQDGFNETLLTEKIVKM